VGVGFSGLQRAGAPAAFLAEGVTVKGVYTMLM
jgi:hypothetical protein